VMYAWLLIQVDPDSGVPMMITWIRQAE
jgi:hypothetical protein